MNQADPAPGQVGIIADVALQRHLLKTAVANCGFSIGVNCEPDALEPNLLQADSPIHAWIVELADEERWADFISDLLDQTEAPLLFGLGAAPERQSEDYPRWERRLYSKLSEALDSVAGEDAGSLQPLLEKLQPSAEQLPRPEQIPWPDPAEVAHTVWVICASLGGPAAVKAFLDRLPPQLPVAFVYAQHIDSGNAQALAKVLGRHSAYHLVPAANGHRLRYGEVLQVPTEQEMVFDTRGKVQLKDHGWPGPYGPSIDQTLLNVSGYYRDHCHALIFSGMGNDGAIAAPALAKQGSRIWTQSADSCACASMPESVVATGCVQWQGAPEHLAEKFVETLAEHHVHA